MDEWPWSLLTPHSERWRLQGVALGSGVNAAGWRPMSRSDGGGLWVAEQTTLIYGRDAIIAARAVEALLDGGVGRMVAWSHERPFAPDGLDDVEAPFDDGVGFDDDALWLTQGGVAVVAGDASLRATALTISLDGVFDLRAGMRFSLVHPTKGIRRYVIRKIDGDEIEIRPPLREAVTAGAVLDFIKVGCVCWLANPDELLDALDAQRGLNILTATAQWVEAF